MLFSCSKQKEDLPTNNLETHFDEAYNLELSKEQRIKHIDSALNIVNQQSEKDSLKIKNTFKVANRYYALLEYEKYFKVSQEVLSLAIKKKDTLQIAKAEYYLGDYYFYTSKNDSAYYYYLRAKKKYLKTNDEYNLATTTLHLARVLLFEKDFLGSETQTIKALKIANKLDEKALVYECFDNLGRALSGQKKYKQSLDYYNKSYNQIDNLKNNINVPLFKGQTLNNIGHTYINIQEYKLAYDKFKKGLEIKKLKELHPSLYSSLLDHFAYTKFKLKNKEILPDFNEALKIRDSIDDVAGKINSRIHLTEYYLDKKDTLKAKLLNQEAYTLAKESNYNKEVLTTLDFFTKIEPKKGLYYAQEYIKLSDSLQEQERNIRNKLARIEFETDEIILEKEAITNQKSIIILISVVLLFIGSLLYTILYLRSREKQLLFTQQQQEANEKIYQMMLEQQTKLDEAKKSEKKRIARELHDGVMNKLASTRLNLFVLNKKTDEITIKRCLPHINEIQNIEKEVRSIAHELSNEPMINSNFRSILVNFFNSQKEIFNSGFSYIIDESIVWEEIDTKLKMNIYRILQEALQNTYKYAKAKNTTVKIEKNNNSISLNIIDDGVGFDLNRKKKGIGIKNMCERAKSCNAELKINSEIDKGTSISLNIKRVK